MKLLPKVINREKINISGQIDDPEFNFQNIDVGEYSTPQLFDLNKDGLLDLVIGEENGNLNYYRNNGTEFNPDFILITDSLGYVDVNAPEITFTLTGYSIPHFFNNSENEIELIVGSEQGKIYYFKDIENNLTGEFAENDSLFLILNNSPIGFPGILRSAPAVAELDNDGFLEMIVGNYSGGVAYYEGSASPSVAETNEFLVGEQFNVFPNPAKNTLTVSCKDIPTDLPVLVEIHSGNLISVVLLRANFTSPLVLDIRSLPQGLYFLRIVSDKTSEVILTKKFVKSQ